MMLIKKKPIPSFLVEYKRTTNASFDNLPREIKINPQEKSDILTITYTSNGEIKSSNLDYQNDFDDTLNLNDIFGLVKTRKEALDSLKRNLARKNTHLTGEAIRRIYTRYLEAEVKESYVGILLWYLQRRMK